MCWPALACGPVPLERRAAGLAGVGRSKPACRGRPACRTAFRRRNVVAGGFPGAIGPRDRERQALCIGCKGQGPDLQEGITCLDAETGQEVLAAPLQRLPDDTILPALRHGGARQLMPRRATSICKARRASWRRSGRMAAVLWQHSLMEEFGRLTFPTAAPLRRCSTPTWSSPAASPQLGLARPGSGPVLCLRQEDGRAGLGVESGRAAEKRFLFTSAAWLV